MLAYDQIHKYSTISLTYLSYSKETRENKGENNQLGVFP